MANVENYNFTGTDWNAIPIPANDPWRVELKDVSWDDYILKDASWDDDIVFRGTWDRESTGVKYSPTLTQTRFCSAPIFKDVNGIICNGNNLVYKGIRLDYENVTKLFEMDMPNGRKLYEHLAYPRNYLGTKIISEGLAEKIMDLIE